ncbi:MAG TPA: ABC transporter permease [Gemmatimonadaceae bacterium]|nr:ABC transporter permease [Gemmatimonadaceae bacterium]
MKKRRFRLSSILPNPRRDISSEIRFHIEMRAREFMAAGMPPDEARRAAIDAFGDVVAIEEACRTEDVQRIRVHQWRETMQSIWQDLRFAARTLAKTPAFTVVMIVTLALGIGANTAIFSLINGVLLQPLPYASGDRIVELHQPVAAADVENAGFSPVELSDYRQSARSLTGLVEYHSMPFILLGGDEPRRVQTGVVSAEFFDLLGVKPILGRTFRAGEDSIGAEPVLVLSYDFWQTEFGGDQSIIGRTFTMNDHIHTVVGVLSAVPQYPNENDVYMPVSACPFRSGEHVRSHRGARMLNVFGVLKSDRTLDEAKSELTTIANRLHADHPDEYPAARRYGTTAVTLREELTANARPTLLVLLGTAGFLLLIVCANVANLTLARLIRREKEMALRTALGASRGRLFRQLLTESALVTLVGAVAGLLLAYGGLDLLKAFVARFTTRAAEVRIDSAVLLFTLGISTLTAFVLGALPALPSRSSLVDDLKEGTNASAGGGRHRARGALIIAQVAVSVVLLAGAGLMMRSFIALLRVNPGFDAQKVVTARLDLNWTKYETDDQIRALTDQLLARIRTEPGVVSAAVSSTFPLNNTGYFNSRVTVEGMPVAEGDIGPRAYLQTGSPDYFRTMGIPLVMGRTLIDADRDTANTPIVVNQTAARRFWPGKDPLGRRISFNNGESWAMVVGVVGDVKALGLDQEVSEEVYGPWQVNAFRDLRLTVRTMAAENTAARQIREAVRALDPGQPVTEIRTLEEVRSESLASPRLTTTLLGLFAALALVITATGLAGVIAHSVGQRTREIGIRMALGAEKGQVLRMVLNQGLGLVAAGLLIGGLGALAITRLMSGLLFQVTPRDPITFVAVSFVLIGVAILACLAPARRATTIQPIIALRST